VEYILRRQSSGGGQNCLSNRATTYFSAFLHNRRTSDTVDSSVHASSSGQPGVGRIHDPVDGDPSDVALQQADLRTAE